MRVLITGGAGLLGSALRRAAPWNVDAVATRHIRRVDGGSSVAVDLGDRFAVQDVVAMARPDVVIHTAYAREDGERNIVEATTNVADACAELGARLVHVSSDVVFGGEDAPYTEDAAPDPVHAYGDHKARAEVAVRDSGADATIVRTSLMVGVAPTDDVSRWMLDAIDAGGVDLFVDELRQPSHVDEVATALWELAGRADVWEAARRLPAVHVVGPEVLSRHTLGLLVAGRHGKDLRRIRAAPSADHPSPRPRDLRLSTVATAGTGLSLPGAVGAALHA